MVGNVKYKFDDPDLVESAAKSDTRSARIDEFSRLFIRQPPLRSSDQVRYLYRRLLNRSCSDAEVDAYLSKKRRPRGLKFYLIAKAMSQCDEYRRNVPYVRLRFPMHVRVAIMLLPRSWKRL